MNLLSMDDVRAKVGVRLRAILRHVDPFRRVDAFSSSAGDAIGRIYVINLDREALRWGRTHREITRFRDRENKSLSGIVRRYSGVDARYLEGVPDPRVLRPNFTLAEQLKVHAEPLLGIDAKAHANLISMTRPEIAIALSHIGTWRLIADGSVERVLVVEDDIMMRPGFRRRLDREWPTLVEQNAELVYLAYRDVGKEKKLVNKIADRRTSPGLWEASGYVLSRSGARKLLASLPANGPIDLWMNFRFKDVRTYSTSKPVLEQRASEPSTNSYSVLPVLSQVGAITRERPLVAKSKALLTPVVAIGSPGSGLTSIATALSMLGYTVVHDLRAIPEATLLQVQRNKSVKSFNAFVNVGNIDEHVLRNITRNKHARLIATGTEIDHLHLPNQLHLPHDAKDKWGLLSEFLTVEYPSFDFPLDQDLGQRESMANPPSPSISHRELQWDRSPWILAHRHSRVALVAPTHVNPRILDLWESSALIDKKSWRLREDTFPSNLAIFRPENVVRDEFTILFLRAERSAVRAYSSAAIASQKSYLFGSFRCALRPARGSGVITGMFLHRNSPRQEIDIEFLGKDTTKMLVNVFYNPGPEGTKLEFGYRGTPTEVDLGFDAADDFHDYEIEWRTEIIRWKVDNQVVYERHLWDPTPIPDRPLEFNINIWSSRSIEFAGRLNQSGLPAATAVKRIEITT